MKELIFNDIIVAKQINETTKYKTSIKIDEDGDLIISQIVPELHESWYDSDTTIISVENLKLLHHYIGLYLNQVDQGT